MQAQLLHSCSLLVLHPFSLKASPQGENHHTCLAVVHIWEEVTLYSILLYSLMLPERLLGEGYTLCPGNDSLRTYIPFLFG